jgi:hypothetical protein
MAIHIRRRQTSSNTALAQAPSRRRHDHTYYNKSESRVLASGGAHASYYRRRVRIASRHRLNVIPVRARTRHDGQTSYKYCIIAGSRVLASGGARASHRHTLPRSKSYRASSRSVLARGTMMMTMTKKSKHLVLLSASTSAAATAASVSSLSPSPRDRCHNWRRFWVGVVGVLLLVNDGVGVHGAVSERPSRSRFCLRSYRTVLHWLGGNTFRVSSGVPVCSYCVGGCCSRPAPHRPTGWTTSALVSFLYLVHALTRRIAQSRNPANAPLTHSPPRSLNLYT